MGNQDVQHQSDGSDGPQVAPFDGGYPNQPISSSDVLVAGRQRSHVLHEAFAARGRHREDLSHPKHDPPGPTVFAAPLRRVSLRRQDENGIRR